MKGKGVEASICVGRLIVTLVTLQRRLRSKAEMLCVWKVDIRQLRRAEEARLRYAVKMVEIISILFFWFG